VKLWVDNSIIIQQWTSLHTTTPSGTIAFGRADGYYDISALYKCSGVAACNYQLQWESTVSGVAAIDVAKSRIRSDRLFQRLDVPNGPSGLHVQPAVTCAAESTAKAPGLTLSTAGVDASFTIQSKDAYENLREDTSGVFTLSIHGSGGSPYVAGSVMAAAPSTEAKYTASYNLQNAKGYEVFVKHGNENIKGSPFTLTVKPAQSCGSRSTIQGTGLTAAALSPAKSAFTIQARDEYGNARTQGTPTDTDYVVRVVRTSGTNLQGTNGLPPFYGSTAVGTSPTLHASFNTATNDGRFAGSYQVPATPDPAVLNHYLYASFVHKGGIMASYYTTADDGATYSAPKDLNTGSSAVTKHLERIGNIALTTANAAGPWGTTGINADNSAEFVVRYNGLYKNTGQTAKYFKWAEIVRADRVKLWVDNKLIIDQWTSLANIDHVESVTVTTPGTGYSHGDAIVVSDHKGGSGFAGTCDVGVHTITVSNGGGGYTASTNVAVTVTTANGCTGLAATCVVSAGGVVTGVTITNYGTGCTGDPVVTCDGGTTNAQLDATKGRVVGVSIASADKGSGYDPNDLPVMNCGTGGSGVVLAPVIGQLAAAYTFDAVDKLYDVQLEYKRESGAQASKTPQFKDSTDNTAYNDVPSTRLYKQNELSGSPYAVSVSC
jgi:hypothetical protein